MVGQRKGRGRLARPSSIVTFERCWGAYTVLTLLGIVLQWSAFTAALSSDAQGIGSGAANAVLAIAMVIYAMLLLGALYLVGRRGSNIGRVLVTAWFGWNLFSLARGLLGGGWRPDLAHLLALLALVLQGVAVAMLFRADARAWFGKREPLA